MAEKVERTPSARRRTSVGAGAATVVRELIGEVISDGFGSSGSGTKLCGRLCKMSLRRLCSGCMRAYLGDLSWSLF
jgi:hypothetical protein